MVAATTPASTPKPKTTTPTAIKTTTAPPKISTTHHTSISSSPSALPSPRSGSVASPPPATKTANNAGIIAGAVGGAAVLVIVVAGMFLLSKRRRAREAREAEWYQQETLMHKHSEGGSMNGYGDRGAFPLHQHSSAEAGQHRQHRMNKQPEWFSKKSPLEYYSQVPPIDELMRQQKEREEQEQLQQQQQQQQQLQQRQQQQLQQQQQQKQQQQQQHQQQQLQQQQQQQQQQQYQQYQQRLPFSLTHESGNTSSSGNGLNPSSYSTPITKQGVFIPIAADDLSSNSHSKQPGNGELVGLASVTTNEIHPSARSHHQQQYQHPRITTAGFQQPSLPGISSTISPTIMSTSNPHPAFYTTSPTNLSYSGSASRTLVSPVTNYQGSPHPTRQFSPNSSFSYTPPPPSSSEPSTTINPLPSQPSTGFYDLLDDSNNLATQNPADHLPRAPPPIPRSTRPMSGSSKPSKSKSVDLPYDPSAPAVPAMSLSSNQHS